ncbi:MAG TPA: hypothetical protein VGG33_28065 [Polyangia bacterium]
MAALVGSYRVKRISGFLPPFGVSKRLERTWGCTYLFGIPFGRFDISGRRFVYRFWPIVDVIDVLDGTRIEGRGRLFGFFTFCRFRLEAK